MEIKNFTYINCTGVDLKLLKPFWIDFSFIFEWIVLNSVSNSEFSGGNSRDTLKAAHVSF